MHRLAVGEPFDRANRRAVGLDREHQARAHGRAVELDRAGAADSVLATEARRGEAEVVAQEIGEELASLYLPLDLAAVDDETDDGLVARRAHDAAPNASRSARRVSTATIFLR